MNSEIEKIINSYYEEHDEDARFATKHGKVEFLTTMHYIEKYLKIGDRVLEIGAGTGRYSHELAQNGYKVYAIELSPHNIERFNGNTVEGEDVTIMQGNALDLSCFKSGTFDVTLLLGPMYHLFTEKDRKRAIAEALRVTKRGGKIFVSYCGNDATIIQFYFGKGMTKTPPYDALVDKQTFKASSTPKEIFVLYRKEEIDKLMAEFKCERLHFVGTDMATGYMRETIDAMDDDAYALYLKYVLATCERRDLAGASNHFLDVLKKL